MSISDYLAKIWLSELESCWVSLHSTSPELDDLSSEITGGAYERQSVTFTKPDETTQKIIWNETKAKFGGMPACTVAYIGGWNVQYNGKLLWWLRLEDSERVKNGSNFVIKPGEIDISIA